jgi:hypothetical protein
MWALRHAERCPGDIWESVYDYQLRHDVSDQAAFAAAFSSRIFSLFKDGPPLEVDSAFGGLGIYKTSFFTRAPNPYLGYKVKVVVSPQDTRVVRWQTCEHVHFHQGLRSIGGRLFVLPGLINGAKPELKVDPSFFRACVF